MQKVRSPPPQTPATRGLFKAWSRSQFGFAPSAYSKSVMLTLHSHFSFILFKIPFNIKVTCVTTRSPISTCDWVNCFACVFQCLDLLEVCFFWRKLGRLNHFWRIAVNTCCWLRPIKPQVLTQLSLQHEVLRVTEPWLRLYQLTWWFAFCPDIDWR